MKNVVLIKSVKNILFSIIILVTIISCRNNEFSSVKLSNNSVQPNDTMNVLSLLETKCYSCHSISSNSHDEIIAPPLAAIKQRYLRSYAKNVDFVKAISEWIQEPKVENALMRGAVNKFKVMPYLLISETEANLIGNFIYNNELEKPAWFQQHFNQEHQNGKGRGNGFKNGNGQGRGKNRF